MAFALPTYVLDPTLAAGSVALPAFVVDPTLAIGNAGLPRFFFYPTLLTGNTPFLIFLLAPTLSPFGVALPTFVIPAPEEMTSCRSFALMGTTATVQTNFNGAAASSSTAIAASGAAH